jgi:hypothetical protein
MTGFSPRNLKYRRAIADAWPDAGYVQAVLARLPCDPHLALLDKLHNQGLRLAAVVVPERSIGSGFADEALTQHGFFRDWTVAPRNLCNAPGIDEPRVCLQVTGDAVERPRDGTITALVHDPQAAMRVRAPGPDRERPQGRAAPSPPPYSTFPVSM